jgi:dihydrodipicolinate synthase/N-acetylneuraminate lyase
MTDTGDLRALLASGLVIPAHPLALTAQRKLDERRQAALTRYYCDAGAGGVAVGVHTTQFTIRDAGLYGPVLQIAAEEARSAERRSGRKLAKIAGVCGATHQATSEAGIARKLGFDAGLLSLAALQDASADVLLAHCRAVAGVIPVMGFYLQPAVGGRILPYEFWREFVDIPNVVAIKVAPFNRYQTVDVARAVVDSGRAGEIALYTGNDDNIVADLLTEFRFASGSVRFVGGLLGHWAVWTRRAVELLEQVRCIRSGDGSTEVLLVRSAETTDANGALFDVNNGFRGCIAGLHEILRRQGMMAGRWCLDPKEDLSPGQMSEIDRVCAAYPHLADDDFVSANLDRWLN